MVSRLLAQATGLLALTAVTSGSGGCLLQAAARSERLRDAVGALNDAARWGRLDVASERVGPAYRARFVDRRRAWGREVRLADVELLEMRLAPDGERARVWLEVSWYAPRTMLLRTTRLEQHWHARGEGFVLVDEKLIDGDASLWSSGRTPAVPVSTGSGQLPPRTSTSEGAGASATRRPLSSPT
ncbi:MAG: hypothetical protein NZ898_00245 [Myxococcota bacterium]|nr:hypothetical protein [Myxococcota bacterium]MDW8361974.1 hypothetical protein [Myxococcales bacterium]